MDKFVTRTKTWQTITYTSTIQKSKKDLQTKNISKRKPLRESQIQQTVSTTEINSSLSNNKRRLSIRDEHLLKIFTSKPDQPLMPTMNEDSGLSSSSQGSLESFNDIQHAVAVEHNQTLGGGVNSCKLSDYVNNTDSTRSQQKLLVSQTPPPVSFNEVLIENNQTPINPVLTTASNNTGITTITFNSPQITQLINNNVNELFSNKEHTTPIAIKQNLQMARIQSDMNSPSATLRVRAIRALKNPTNAVYSNFDIPHEEQDIITLEERQAPPPPSIEELMRDVIVYVEVRTGEDNRSEGVKKVISQLGARVNDKLLRGTTHVIFKDGLLSTYKKAKNWNIPVVSILWVEACKNKRMICDPKEYPISNIDRYENPELYDKMKRHKSMQPDSECNKRIRLKQGTTATKDSTPKTVAETLIKTPIAVNDSTPKSRRKQTDISQFFKKLANANSTHIATDNNVVPGSTTSIRQCENIAESPATQLLNRIESNTFTTLQPRRIASETNSMTRSIASSIKSSNSGDASQQTVISAGSKKSLQFPTPTKRSSPRKKIITLVTPKKRILQRRTSVQMPVASSTSTQSLQATETITPGPMTRRRSSIHSTINMSLSSLVPSTPDLVMTPQGNPIQFSAIEEETDGKEADSKTKNNENKTAKGKSSGSPKSPKPGAATNRRIIRRRTTYTNKTPDMSPLKSPAKAKSKAPNKRRTLYTPRMVEENLSSELSLTEINEQSKVLDENLLKFALTPTNTLIGSSQKGIPEIPIVGHHKDNIEPGALLEEHSSTMIFSSTRLPSVNRRRTLFDVSMDIIQQRLHNINNSARRSVVKEFIPSNEVQSPSILPRTNEILDNDARRVEAAPKTAPLSTPATTTNETTSPPRTIKKRKLFVPNDTSLVLTATPPTTSSAKKANTADISSAKRRRTITPQVLTKSRKSIATGNAKSDVIIKRPQTPTSLTKSAAQLANNTIELGLTRKVGGGVNGRGGETLFPHLKIKTSKICSTVEISGPALTEKCIAATACETIGGGGLGASEVKKVVTTTAMFPQSKGSFVSIISSKASDTTIKQQLTLQQHDLMEVDENVAINTPAAQTSAAAAYALSNNMQKRDTTAALSKTTTEISTVTSTSATTTATSCSAISNEFLTTQAKVVKKSQMSAIPETIKDAVVVGAAGSCTQMQRNTEGGGKKKWPYIVCTNMHREQIKVMREAIATLGGLQLSHFVNDEATHVITFEPRRTLNLLRALIRGLWILDYKWALDSLKAGQWLNEEEYELRVFSRAVEICRTERQAFGKTYKCELFSDLGTFYISSRCGPISKDNLKELIELCGGKVVDHRKRAKYILGDPHKTLEDKIYVTPFWVLDSITQMQVMRQQKYIYAGTTLTTKTQQTQLPQSNMIDVVSSN